MKDIKQRGDFAPLIPRGVQCVFGEEVRRRRSAEFQLAEVLQRWGFDEIRLPFFDYVESFSYGLGSHLADKTYRFLDRDGSHLALRPDLTTLVAKTVATRMKESKLPIKLFYSGEVFRHERPGAGKQKEYYQIGMESLGGPRSWLDIEAVLLSTDCLLTLGVREFKIALGHMGFFSGILNRLDLSPARAEAVRHAIDHKDSAWLREAIADLDLSSHKKAFLLDLPNFAGGAEVLDQALEVVENPESREALNELAGIGSVMRRLGLEEYLTFDLAEVRSLDYYTGIVFKIYSRDLGFELGGGGRYDGLLAQFGWNLPAVGFSLTLDRVLTALGDFRAGHTAFDEQGEIEVMTDDGSVEGVFEQVWALRRQGRRVRLGRRR